MNGLFRRTVLALVMAALSMPVIHAKRIICIEGSGGSYLHAQEGWEREHMQPGDVITVGGNLTDCMNQVEDGDVLVIVAHGRDRGKGFVWDGTTYGGFGDEAGDMPVPAGWASRSNVRVILRVCWGGRDPDGSGPEKSLKDEAAEELGGSGNVVEGYPDLAESPICWDFTCTPPVTPAEAKKIEDALNRDVKLNGPTKSSFSDYPPPNRPGATNTMLSKGQQIVDSVIGAGRCVLTVYFKEPRNQIDYQELFENSAAGMLTRALRYMRKLLGISFIAGTADPFGDNGIVTMDFDSFPLVDRVDYPAPVFPGPGLWRTDDPVIFPDFATRVQSTYDLGSAMKLVFNESLPIPEPGFNQEILVSGLVKLNMSLNGGISYHAYEAPFTGICIMVSPVFLEYPQPAYYTDIEVVSFTIAGGELPPGTEFQRNMTQASSGMMRCVLIPEESIWETEGYLYLNLDLNSGGILHEAVAPVRIDLSCPQAEVGSLNSYSGNYNECAFFSSGLDQIPAEGCTYPAASNYQSGASIDDGSCLFSEPCPSDLSEDGLINTTDLLLFLGDYGTSCP